MPRDKPEESRFFPLINAGEMKVSENGEESEVRELNGENVGEKASGQTETNKTSDALIETMNKVSERLEAQESKLSELLTAVHGFCAASSKSTEQIVELLKLTRKEQRARNDMKDWMEKMQENYQIQLTNVARAVQTLDQICEDNIHRRDEDEAAKNQMGADKKKEMRAANLATPNIPRCCECQTFGHYGNECPNPGQGIRSYKCNELGNHIAKFRPRRKNDRSGYSKGK
ncbi:uncharacterized protein LOC107044771 isoform X2 [Diachasma alloeum]|uniref:uncharacterized protein LOC107044771 isoform X2 n=1 Tax=Diachasma alloeum TaxID=454923 RepID=UPI0007383CC1|nr:uncharacterized protein LOC107044771 isoform X2 [Diachasma alloeum]